MNNLVTLRGTESEKFLQTVITGKTPAIMSYLYEHKWHVAKVLLTNLEANRLYVRILPSQKPHPINIRIDQPVGISSKYVCGKFILETRVIGFESPQQTTSDCTVVLAAPNCIETVQRRSYFRIEVPKSLKINVVLWHRRYKSHENQPLLHENYQQGKLVDISAGGAQIAIAALQKPDFKKGQFLGMRFTPFPYETPLMFNGQIRNILPTADSKNICLGLQIVGLESSPEGHETLQRLCSIVDRYHQINLSETN